MYEYVLECGALPPKNLDTLTSSLLCQLPYSPELHLQSWTSHLTRGEGNKKNTSTSTSNNYSDDFEGKLLILSHQATFKSKTYLEYALGQAVQRWGSKLSPMKDILFADLVTWNFNLRKMKAAQVTLRDSRILWYMARSKCLVPFLSGGPVNSLIPSAPKMNLPTSCISMYINVSIQWCLVWLAALVAGVSFISPVAGLVKGLLTETKGFRKPVGWSDSASACRKPVLKMKMMMTRRCWLW